MKRELMRALVTGGAKRLGKEMAIFLAERGFEVAIHYHSDENSAIDTEPCFGDYRTEPDDNCQQPLGQQAWSSPIFVDHK